jgi:hypothetical protein
MKLTITIGVDTKGKPLVIAGPDENPDGQKTNLRAITDAGGKFGKGKDAIKLSEAYVMHTAKGILDSRKF